MDLFGIVKNVTTFLGESMDTQTFYLASSGRSLGNVNVIRGLLQGDSL